MDNTSLAIGSIFKNEAPYIVEWLAYHRVMGVEKFFIADNVSNDATTLILQGLNKLGLLTHIYFPTEGGAPPQLPAYRQIMEKYGSEAEWFAFIDADEFIFPIQHSKKINEVISSIVQGSENAGALALNWASYGSNHHKNYDAKPVVERFQTRGFKDFEVNKHYKTLVKSEAYLSTGENPHFFQLKEGYHYIDSKGDLLQEDKQGRKGISNEVCWDNIRLNHYIIKSYEEFVAKRNRGRATVATSAGLNRTDAFFFGHNKNDEREVFPEDLLLRVKAEIDRIESKLVELGLPKDVLLKAEKPAGEHAVGFVDKAIVNPHKIEFHGWAFFPSGKPGFLTAKAGSKTIPIFSYTRINRQDVLNNVPGATLGVGFRIEILTADALKYAKDSEITISLFSEENTFSLKPSAGYVAPILEGL
ncbi:glycosyltransferase family 92 protein [Pseudomonas syringae]|nr:glycosyltransferase family 92 protein [Pseudomonas syringae]